MHYSNIKFIESPEIHKMQGLSHGYLRVLHAIPDAPSIDVYANNKLIAKNLSYKQITAYMPIPQGVYEISLYAAGSSNSPIVINSININPDTKSTVAAAGTLCTASTIEIPDHQIIPLNINESSIRFIHLSPNAPAIDITWSNGSIIFANISYKERTLYKTVPANKYTLQVRVAGTSTVALTIPDTVLESKTVYTIYVIGFLGGTPELEALIILDGFYI